MKSPKKRRSVVPNGMKKKEYTIKSAEKSDAEVLTESGLIIAQLKDVFCKRLRHLAAIQGSAFTND